MADLDTLANNATKALKKLKSHLEDGRKTRNTMAGVARTDWTGTYRTEFETGLRNIYSQSTTTETDIDNLIALIGHELTASKQAQPTGTPPKN